MNFRKVISMIVAAAVFVAASPIDMGQKHDADTFDADGTYPLVSQAKHTPNCHGSLNCIGLNTMPTIVEYVRAIALDRYFQDGEQIACARGICVFLQHTHASFNGSAIQNWVYQLNDLGCKACGSVPAWVPGTDPNGELTVNSGLVEGEQCVGLCYYT